MVGSPICNLFAAKIFPSLLLVVGIGLCAPCVDLLMLPCFFLSGALYWLNSWLLECVFLLVHMGVGCVV